MAIEDSSYNDTPGVKIKTAEGFEINGNLWNKFHTTRKVIVQLLKSEKLRADIAAGQKFKVKCVYTKAEGKGKDYYTLVDVE